MPPNVLRGLVVFCAAARYLSFKMAADELCITPSAVSHQIRALEDQVGDSLFERRTRAIVLTATGAALYSQAEPLLRALEGVTTGFLGRRRPSRHTLRIALPPFFASEMFIPRLGEFSRDHPLIDLRLETTSVRGSDYPAGSDASVLLLPEPPPDHEACSLFSLKLVPACAPKLLAGKRTLGLEAFGDNALIIHKSRPDAWNDWFTAVGAKFQGQPRIIHLDSMFAVARAAEQGLGIALAPMPLIQAWFDGGALVKLSDKYLDTGDRYYFVYDRDDPDIHALRDWVSAAFREDE